MVVVDLMEGRNLTGRLPGFLEAILASGRAESLCPQIIFLTLLFYIYCFNFVSMCMVMCLVVCENESTLLLWWVGSRKKSDDKFWQLSIITYHVEEVFLFITTSVGQGGQQTSTYVSVIVSYCIVVVLGLERWAITPTLHCFFGIQAQVFNAYTTNTLSTESPP